MIGSNPERGFLLLLKQMMCRFLKQNEIEEKSVSELLKLDIKNTDIQVKDSELEIGVHATQALKNVTNSGKQKQCCLSIRSFLIGTGLYVEDTWAKQTSFLKPLHVPS